jgi:hypothetical protein
MTDALTRLAAEASSRDAERILEGGQAYAGQGLPANTRTGEVTASELEDEARRARHDDGVDPWGYAEPDGEIVEYRFEW